MRNGAEEGVRNIHPTPKRMKSIRGINQRILNCGRMSEMKNAPLLLCILGLLVLWVTAPFATSHRDDNREDLLAASQQTSVLAQQVLEATVHFVQVVKRGEGGEIERGSGSGFVVDSVKGWVMTRRDSPDLAPQSTTWHEREPVAMTSPLGEYSITESIAVGWQSSRESIANEVRL